ncbi:hypothetical protein NCF86_00320 [Pelagerythrobacter marinus]|nr:hypothetical protein NCF86_00320 [Pelagerythrobacter marinus]
MATDINSTIEKLVRERLADVSVEEVRITRDQDDDGECVYRVMIVYDASKAGLKAEKTASLARHIRHKLLDMHDHSFPFFRFVSTRDAKGLAAA